MKEHPILFSAPMVRAILDGRKVQTRRVVKPSYNYDGKITNIMEWREQDGRWFGLHGYMTAAHCSCPYGKPGDRLWVRETFSTGNGIVQANRVLYRASDEWLPPGGKWRPSIHMPRWASRITLEIVGIRVERLQDISEADAMAEGARCADEVTGREVLFPLASKCGSYRLHYRSIWEQINGPGSWDANPWVWVIEFRRLA